MFTVNLFTKDNTPVDISLRDICQYNGIETALKMATYLDSTHNKDLRLFAVWCARQVQHLMTDTRCLKGLDVAERFANGEVTQEELGEAQIMVWKASESTGFDNVAHSAYCAVFHNINDAVSYAAHNAARAINDTERTKQTEMFIRMCEGTAPWQLKD